MEGLLLNINLCISSTGGLEGAFLTSNGGIPIGGGGGSRPRAGRGVGVDGTDDSISPSNDAVMVAISPSLSCRSCVVLNGIVGVGAVGGNCTSTESLGPAWPSPRSPSNERVLTTPSGFVVDVD